MEGVQELTWLLEEQFKPLVHAEMSVLVDVLHRPELLFAPGSEARKRCEIGGFISKCASMAFSSRLAFFFAFRVEYNCRLSDCTFVNSITPLSP